MKLDTGGKEIQQVNPGGPDKQPEHEVPTISSIPIISSIDKYLSRNRHRVSIPTHRRAIKEESKVADHDWVDHQVCSMLLMILIALF